MTRITIAKGDGIGPEIMDATIEILKAAGAQLEYDEIHDQRNYECIRKFESNQVFIHIFKKVAP
jgi:isocitrate/isopropylmalate dehydrogenase